MNHEEKEMLAVMRSVGEKSQASPQNPLYLRSHCRYVRPINQRCHYMHFYCIARSINYTVQEAKKINELSIDKVAVSLQIKSKQNMMYHSGWAASFEHLNRMFCLAWVPDRLSLPVSFLVSSQWKKTPGTRVVRTKIMKRYLLIQRPPLLSEHLTKISIGSSVSQIAISETNLTNNAPINL